MAALLACFHLVSLSDSRRFDKYDMIRWETAARVREILGMLKKDYKPFKAVVYLDPLSCDDLRCITILKQMLRQRGYTLASYKLLQQGEKWVSYQLKRQEPHRSWAVRKASREVTLTW